MKVIATLALFVCLSGYVAARDERLSADCLNAVTHREECCAAIPDAELAHLKNPSDCGSFYHCEHGNPTWKACPAGLHWSVAADRCEWPHLAGCEATATQGPTTGEPTSTTQKPSTTGAPPTTTEARPSSTGAPPSPSTTGAPPSPSTTGAPPSPSTTGAPPSPSTTSAPPSTTGAPPTTTAPSTEDECAPEPTCHQCLNGVFPADLCCRDVKTYHKLSLANANDCSSYYTCVNNHAILRQCPKGLHWSINSERCEWPEDAKCSAAA